MKPRNAIFIVALASLFAILPAGTANAAAAWSSNAGGCVPEDPTIEQNIHSTATGGMRVRFRPGKMGTIKLVCPVTVTFDRDVGPISAGGERLVLAVYYQDPDGSEADYLVKAHLRSVRLSDGAHSTLCSTDSNSAGSSAQWSKMECYPDRHLGKGHVYWVEIEVKSQKMSGGEGTRPTGTVPIEDPERGEKLKTVEINAVELVSVGT